MSRWTRWLEFTMRFNKRLTFMVVWLLFFGVLSALHLFRQFEVLDLYSDLELQDSHRNSRQNYGPEPQGKRESPSSNRRHQDGELPPPSLRGERHTSNGRDESKLRQQPNEAAANSKKGWDDGEIVRNDHPWQQFHRDIHQDALYSENAPYMADLLHDLATVEIVNASQFKGGTQVKLDFRLADGNRAMGKPMRMSREFVYKYNHEEPFWLDPERHNAEIAAFHLDRVLGFRRVTPCTGRIINLTQEIVLKSQDQEFLNTFYRKDGDLCFNGTCLPWFCNKDHPSCGKGDLIEVSMCQFLPSFEGGFPVSEQAYPWSQGVKESKVWREKNICPEYIKDPVWVKGRYFLDLIEQGIFDFFIRNYDRHHFDMLRKYKKDGFVVFLDNGKGFGNPHEDDVTFLAPVYQCCKVRRATYLRLKQLMHPESRLSDLLRSPMSRDPIAPVVTEDHLHAMDRRLETVLQTIDKCILDNGESQVLVERLDD